MKRTTPLALAILTALLLGWPTPTRGQAAQEGSTLQRIDAAHRAGLLDAATRDWYRALRVLDRSRLPTALQAEPGAERPLRCGTRFLRAAQRVRSQLTRSQRQLLDQLRGSDWTPTPHADSYFSDHFELIVGSTGTDTGTVDKWLALLEQAWTAHTVDGGFALPPCADTQPFRVYLGDTGPDVPSIEPDVYGWSDLDNQSCPYMVVQQDYPAEPSPLGMAQVTGAHEFHHGVQAAYDWYDPDYWVEATAVWAEELVFGDVNDYLLYINGDAWLARPDRALAYEDGDHEYGNVLWPLYLAEQHGGPRTIRRIWERCVFETPTGAVDLFLQDQGSSLQAAFLDFVAHLATRDFADGALYDDAHRLASVTTYPDTRHFTNGGPESYGSAYVNFSVPLSTPHRLDVLFSGAPTQGNTTVPWGVVLVSETASGWSAQTLAPNANGHAIGSVNGFGDTVTRVVLATSVLGPSGAQPGAGGVDFGFTATLADDVPVPDGGLPLPDGGITPDAQVSPPDGGGSGCGCRTTPACPAPLAALLLLGGLAWRRRRTSVAGS